MLYKCCVRGCNSNSKSSGKKIKFYRFPSDQNEADAWKERIPNLVAVKRNTVVCSKHWPLDLRKIKRPKEPPSIFTSKGFNATSSQRNEQSKRTRSPETSSSAKRLKLDHGAMKIDWEALYESAVDEIALEGLNGVTFATLWCRLESIGYNLDYATKQLLWSELKHHPELQFYHLDNVYDVIEIPDCWRIASDAEYASCLRGALQTRFPSTAYSYTTRLSILTPSERASVFESVGHVVDQEHRHSTEPSVSIDDAHLVIVAKSSLRIRTILKDTNCDAQVLDGLTILSWIILERLAWARYHGMFITDFAKEKFPIKILYYMFDDLEELQLIRKHTISRQETGSILFFHRRFNIDARYNVKFIYKECKKYLSENPNMKVIPTLHFCRIFTHGKRRHRYLEEAHQMGMISYETFTHEQLYGVVKMQSKKSRNANLDTTYKCIHFNQDWDFNQYKHLNNFDDFDLKYEGNALFGLKPSSEEFPLEPRELPNDLLTRYMLKSGEEGASRRMLFRDLGGNFRFCRRLFEKFTSSNKDLLANRVTEVARTVQNQISFSEEIRDRYNKEANKRPLDSTTSLSLFKNIDFNEFPYELEITNFEYDDAFFISELQRFRRELMKSILRKEVFVDSPRAFCKKMQDIELAYSISTSLLDARTVKRFLEYMVTVTREIKKVETLVQVKSSNISLKFWFLPDTDLSHPLIQTYIENVKAKLQTEVAPKVPEKKESNEALIDSTNIYKRDYLGVTIEHKPRKIPAFVNQKVGFKQNSIGKCQQYKRLHKFLFQYSLDHKDDALDYEDDNGHQTKWFKLANIIADIPVSLFVKLITYEYELGLSVSELEKCSTPVQDLSIEIKERLFYSAYFFRRIRALLCEMTSLNVISLHRTDIYDIFTLELYVHTTAAFIATSYPEKNPDAEIVKLEFKTVADVDHYWSVMEKLSFDRTYNALGKNSNKTVSIAKTLLQSRGDVVDDYKLPRGDGKGVGGTDSLMYFEMQRKWSCIFFAHKTNYRYRKNFIKEKRALKKQNAINDRKRKRAMSCLSAKQARLEPQKPKKRIYPLSAIDAQIRTYRSDRRSVWSSSEDEVIYLAKLSMDLLLQYSSIDVPYTSVRDILHELCPSSASEKDTCACARRSRYITLSSEAVFLPYLCAKNTCALSFDVRKILNEAQTAKNLTEANRYFRLLYKKLNEVIGGDAPLSSHYNIPATLDELYKGYNVNYLVEPFRSVWNVPENFLQGSSRSDAQRLLIILISYVFQLSHYKDDPLNFTSAVYQLQNAVDCNLSATVRHLFEYLMKVKIVRKLSHKDSSRFPDILEGNIRNLADFNLYIITFNRIFGVPYRASTLDKIETFIEKFTEGNENKSVFSFADAYINADAFSALVASISHLFQISVKIDSNFIQFPDVQEQDFAKFRKKYEHSKEDSDDNTDDEDGDDLDGLFDASQQKQNCESLNTGEVGNTTNSFPFFMPTSSTFESESDELCLKIDYSTMMEKFDKSTSSTVYKREAWLQRYFDDKNMSLKLNFPSVDISLRESLTFHLPECKFEDLYDLLIYKSAFDKCILEPFPLYITDGLALDSFQSVPHALSEIQKDVYNFILESKCEGVSLYSLSEKFTDCSPLVDILKTLIRKGLVLVSGISDVIVIASQFSENIFFKGVTIKDLSKVAKRTVNIANDGSPVVFIPHIWFFLDGSFNKSLLRTLLHFIVLYLNVRPAVCVADLAVRMDHYLNTVDLLILLKLLQYFGCLTFEVSQEEEITLFSDDFSPSPDRNHLPTLRELYVNVTSDCIARLHFCFIKCDLKDSIPLHIMACQFSDIARSGFLNQILECST